MRVLSWNLFHGRSLPPSGGALERQFADAIAAWEWDVALLQEVPPWWAPALARRTGAQQRRALTSRNSLPALRRVLASRDAELMKSNGGGCNAVLVRGALAEHRSVRLRRRPERRVAQLVRLADGVCVVNYHGSARVELAEQELARLWGLARSFADGAPLLLGGDLNLREPRVPDPAIVHLAARDVDHVFALGMRADGAQELPERRILTPGGPVELSDHPALLVDAIPDG